MWEWSGLDSTAGAAERRVRRRRRRATSNGRCFRFVKFATKCYFCENYQSFKAMENGLIISGDGTSLDFVRNNTATDITIPDGITTIGVAAFADCASLQSVNIPNSVTEICTSAFSGCTSLQKVTIPDGVTTIGFAAFAGCSSLQSVNIPNSVTTIEGSAFSGCQSLQSIDIPESITTIESLSFYGCTSLKSVHMHSTKVENLNIELHVFHDVNMDECTIYVPAGTLQAYSNHPRFHEYKIVERPREVSPGIIDRLIRKVMRIIFP